MDFHSLCQKIDVESIRARMPPLPAMPQIKLPKSMPKLKSRKIFRSSREDINRNSSPKQTQQHPMGSQPQLAPPIPPAGFIKKTPTRISTIASLMYEENGDSSTYRSADSIDDDFSSLPHHNRANEGDMRSATTDLNQVHITQDSNTQAKLSLTEKLQKGYKDISEFRLKHIFCKKTVVRKDTISVDHYVDHYEEDLAREAREQERQDNAIAENYTFRFKLSRQATGHSNSVTPDDSPRSEQPVARPIGRTVGEHSGDESGMEASPPHRKPGIAATRFAKVRSPPLRQSSSELEIEEEHSALPEPIPSSLWSTKINRAEKDVSNTEQSQPQPLKNKPSYKSRMLRLTGYMSSHEDSDAPESRGEDTHGSTKMLSKLKGFGKRNSAADNESGVKKKQKLPASPISSDEEQQKTANAESPSRKGLRNIKENIKRFHQSMKSRPQTTTDESADESANSKAGTSNTKTSSKTEKLTSRLRRFRSRDVSIENLDDEEEAANPPKQQSPLRQAVTKKLETWTKSFKKKPSRGEAQPSDDESSPEKSKQERHHRSDTFIKRLKHIRTRKSPESKEELDVNTDIETGDDEQKNKSRTNKFHEARQRTFKKVNEKMQQLKFFHKSQDQSESRPSTQQGKKYHSEEEEWDESPQHEAKGNVNIPPTITRRDFPPTEQYDSEPENKQPVAPSPGKTISFPGARAAWTTKSVFSESMDSDADGSDFPRVLLHQDNSDSFEPTLIIAVTRPVVLMPGLNSRITEITAEEEEEEDEKNLQFNQSTEWVSNKTIIAGFRETTPPGSKHKQIQEIETHLHQVSLESNTNLKVERKEHTSRRSSQVGLNNIDDKNEAWKVKPTHVDATNTTIYKTKSIDIFEKGALKGGVLTAFEDFDEELRNAPVLKITPTRNHDSCERESSEDTADDDNSSRITKISVNSYREDNLELSKMPVKQSLPPKEPIRERTLHQYANSRESLIANFDENEENYSEDYDEDDEDDRPPSAAPSPPPSISPPPPPLPQRQPSIRLSKIAAAETIDAMPPPLPKTKPPLPPASVKPISPSPPQIPPAAETAAPPRIPERTTSMTRTARPLVKTSSLRLVYSEQVKPADIGKVNKLISQFEPTEGQATQRPRVIPRRIQQNDSEEYSDDEEDYATMANKLKERYANIKIERDTTPTPTPTNTPKISTPEMTDSPEIIRTKIENQKREIHIKRELIVPMLVTTTDEDNNTQIHIDLKQDLLDVVKSDANSNHSRPNSEYGSPMEYPSSLRSSFEAIPTLEHKDGGQQRKRSVDRRSRRSMTRDNENFYSFDSDEENSYYSISSTGSNRYVVEL